MYIEYGRQDGSIIDFIKQVIEERDAILHDINRKVRRDFIFGAFM